MWCRLQYTTGRMLAGSLLLHYIRHSTELLGGTSMCHPDPLRIDGHTVYIYEDVAALAQGACDYIVGHCARLARQQTKVSLALSGGATPVKVYEKLVSQSYINAIDWQSLLVFFGDERYVDPEDEQSNFRMARHTFLNQAPIPEEQIFAVPTDCAEPADCAIRYGQCLQQQLGADPVIDIMLLGMGDDGHTASLFPGTDILQENQQPAAAVYVSKFDSWRISMTYPVINRAGQVCVLVAGDSKAEVLLEVLSPSPDTHYPIQGIQNPHGLTWLVDRAAAARLRV